MNKESCWGAARGGANKIGGQLRLGYWFTGEIALIEM